MELRSQARGKRAGAKPSGEGGKTLFDQIINNSSPPPIPLPVNQDFWIRYWLAANGIPILTSSWFGYQQPKLSPIWRRVRWMPSVPATPGPTELSGQDWLHGSIDGRNVENHPWRILCHAGRLGWQEPKATKAILKGIMEAQQWLDNFDNRKETADIPDVITSISQPTSLQTHSRASTTWVMVVSSTINRWQRITGKMKR